MQDSIDDFFFLPPLIKISQIFNFFDTSSSSHELNLTKKRLHCRRPCGVLAASLQESQWRLHSILAVSQGHNFLFKFLRFSKTFHRNYSYLSLNPSFYDVDIFYLQNQRFLQSMNFDFVHYIFKEFQQFKHQMFASLRIF